LRTAEGLGIEEVILSGYTPYPPAAQDSRLPHEVRKIQQQIHKTALGAETLVHWRHEPDVFATLNRLKTEGCNIYALEQTKESIPLPSFKPPKDLVLIVGREVEGIETEVLAVCDGALEIPMRGHKESFNVVQAAAMALYHVCYN
jgi:tRNA G18 (ribose-2'-O)-methylase SpoU